MNTRNAPPHTQALLRIVLFTFFIIALSPSCHAGREDVVYMKNGSIYRGVIIDEDPGLNYTIRLYGGSEVVLAVGEVDRVKRERKVGPDEYEFDPLRNKYIRLRLKSQYFRYDVHGFFAQWQTIVGLIDGMRLTAGYRFNPYAALGIGGGFEYGNTIAPAPYSASNGYFPLFLWLSGDMMKTRLAPFYSIEVGYTWPLNDTLYTPNGDWWYYTTPPSIYHSYGGVTSGVGIGVRKYTRHRISIQFSLNMNVGYFRIASTDFHAYDHPPLGGPQGYYATTTANWLALQPSARFGLVF